MGLHHDPFLVGLVCGVGLLRAGLASLDRSSIRRAVQARGGQMIDLESRRRPFYEGRAYEASYVDRDNRLREATLIVTFLRVHWERDRVVHSTDQHCPDCPGPISAWR